MVALAIGVVSVFGLAQASARTTACSGNGPVDHFTLALPSSSFAATAGTPFTATVTAVTHCGATATSYAGSGTLSSNLAQSPNGTNPTVPTPINFVGGISSPSITAVKAVGPDDPPATLTFSASGFTAVSSAGFLVNPGPPDHVEFKQQPNAGGSSSWLLRNPPNTGPLTNFGAVVKIYDAFENLATQENGPSKVTLGLNQAAGLSGTLSGGSSAPAHGVATFTTLTVDQTDIGYTLTASYKTATTDTSAPFSVYLTTAACGGSCSIAQFGLDKNTTVQVQGNGSFAFLGLASVDFTANGVPTGCQSYGEDITSGAPNPVVVADMRTALGGTLDVTYGISKALLQKLFGSTSGSQFIPICVGARRIALDANNNVVAVPCYQQIKGQDQTPWMGKTLVNGKFDQAHLSQAVCDGAKPSDNPLDPGYGYWWGIVGSFQDRTNSNPALRIDPSVNPTVTAWTSNTSFRFFTIEFPASSAIGPTGTDVSAFADVPWDSWMG